MEIAISGVYADMYPIIAPFELGAGIVLFSRSNLFYTSGSLMNGVAGFRMRISDEGAGECFHGGACGDLHGYGPYRE
jgi:hypothetical protein